MQEEELKRMEDLALDMARISKDISECYERLNALVHNYNTKYHELMQLKVKFLKENGK